MCNFLTVYSCLKIILRQNKVFIINIKFLGLVFGVFHRNGKSGSPLGRGKIIAIIALLSELQAVDSRTYAAVR